MAGASGNGEEVKSEVPDLAKDGVEGGLVGWPVNEGGASGFATDTHAAKGLRPVPIEASVDPDLVVLGSLVAVRLVSHRLRPWPVFPCHGHRRDGRGEPTSPHLVSDVVIVPAAKVRSWNGQRSLRSVARATARRREVTPSFA